MVDDFSLKEFDAWLSSAEELRSLRCGYVRSQEGRNCGELCQWRVAMCVGGMKELWRECR